VLRNAREWGGIKVGREWRFPYNDIKELANFLRIVQNGVGAGTADQGDQSCLTSVPVAATGKSGSTEYHEALGLKT
jgi:hypothetical protein